MARIRTIKPEFPHSESMGRVSRDARLLFIQLWTICDDAGRTRGNSRMLASLLFPYDDDAPKLICTWLGELEREGCIVSYRAEGSTYIEIANWLNHQKIDKPSTSKIPAFCESSRILANPLERSSVDQGVDQGVDPPSLRSGGGEISGEISPVPPVDNSILTDAIPGKPVNGKVRISCPYQKILALYDKHLPMCQRVIEWTETRRKHLSALWNRKASEEKWTSAEQGLEYFDAYFEFVARSPFLTGRVDGRNGKPPFVANLEWLVTPSRFANVVEGKYHA